MGLFDAWKNKKKRKSIDKERQHWEALTKESILLFEDRKEWLDHNDYYEVLITRYYLTPQNLIIREGCSFTVDAHTLWHAESQTFRQFITFDELHRAIEQTDNQKAIAFRGMSADNCREYIEKA